jgi:hypothetical protein
MAVADLGGGQQHLVALMVDNSAEQNRGLYRIGKVLDANGRSKSAGYKSEQAVPL